VKPIRKNTRTRARTGTARASRSAKPPSLAAVTGFLADDGHSGFHRLINERVRLGIISALAVTRTLSFSELKALLGVSDGNLSVHARKLEKAGLIHCRKGFHGRIPKTEYSISHDGRDALQRYLKHMEALINATANRS
jgi:DNA-binding HxlR family transcriptional regulator